MNSKTISPHGVSKALDMKDSRSVGMADNAEAITGESGNENLNGECMPVEEDEDAAEGQTTEESVKIRVLPNHNTPSRQEALEHNCTHIPFRGWCQHCVRGKSKSSHHKAGA